MSWWPMLSHEHRGSTGAVNNAAPVASTRAKNTKDKANVAPGHVVADMEAVVSTTGLASASGTAIIDSIDGDRRATDTGTSHVDHLQDGVFGGWCKPSSNVEEGRITQGMGLRRDPGGHPEGRVAGTRTLNSEPWKMDKADPTIAGTGVITGTDRGDCTIIRYRAGTSAGKMPNGGRGQRRRCSIAPKDGGIRNSGMNGGVDASQSAMAGHRGLATQPSTR